MSKLDICNTIVQQAYLLKCLDMELSNLIRLGASDKTPFFGQTDSCFAILVTKFEETYPVFVRRRQFFDYRQESKQLWEDFATQVDLLSGEACLSSLKTEDIIVFKLIGGCTDSFLREKFLKMKNPTLADLKKEATEWEGVRRSMGTAQKLQPSQTCVSAVKPTKYSQSKGQQQQQPKSKSQKDQSQKQGRNCARCGFPAHIGDRPCPALEKLCDRCGIKGHFDKVRGGPNRGQSLCKTKNPKNEGQQGQQRSEKRSKNQQLRQDQESAQDDWHIPRYGDDPASGLRILQIPK